MAKYQKYAEYKDSGVEWLGEIPSHWKLVKLSYKLKLLSGDGITALDIEETGNYPVYGGNGVRGFTEKYNCDGSYPLIGRQGALCGNINVANGKFFATEHAVVVYPYEKFNLTFLSEFLRFMDLGQYSVSAAQPGIAVDRINTLPIVIPPLEEQDSIGDFLDHETAKIDTLIVKQEKLIELLKEKRQAVISHAVTKGLNPNVPMKDSGVEWLGEVPEHWETLPLKLCVETRKGVAFKAVDFCDSGIRVVKASDIKQKTIRESEVFLPDSYINEYPKAVLYTGDLVLSTVGSTPDVKNSAVGQIGKVPESLNGSLLNQNTVVFSANKLLDQGFLFYLVQTNSYRDHLDLNAHGTANQASLNISDMLDFIIPMPETNEQIQITHYLDNKIAKLEELEAKSASMISYLTERRTALISAAVTGKIDVRNWQAPSVTEADTELSA
ncbi:restriction endonuclease subunit S [Acinetobacter baumannii]|uniref:restriction endonuclease subunit S n=1 Tax=Acinetobacter baumannii TaxID=470 RepID=UPI00389223EB